MGRYRAQAGVKPGAIFTQTFAPAPGGVRLAVKDNFDLAGLPTRGGGRRAIVERAERTAPAVQRLLDAGCTLVGRTAMVELAYGGYGTNRATGAPGNPWDADRVCGGSSSGSAAAVAAGLAQIAVGTDTGGSVRIPAALCGVVGLKPQRGRVPLDGVLPLAPSLDTVGPIAADVERAAWALELMAAVPGLCRGPMPDAVAIASSRDADSATAEALGRAAEWVGAAGAMLSVIPAPPDFIAPSGTVLAYEAHRLWRAHAQRHRADMDPAVVARIEQGAAIPAEAYSAQLAARGEARRRELARWNGADVMLLPATPCAAPRFAEIDEAVPRLARFTRLANWLDLPAAVVPAMLSPEGLPVAVQIVGRPGGEAAVVATARAIERARGPIPLPALAHTTEAAA